MPLTFPIPPDQRQRVLAALRAKPGMWRRLHTLQARTADPVIAQAHELLVDVAPLESPMLSDIHVKPCRGWAESWPNGAIHIDPTSPPYRAAQAGESLLPLAAVLIHEEAHVRHGSSEVVAYGAALRFLERHRADPMFIRDVRHRLAEARAVEAAETEQSLKNLESEIRSRHA